MKKCLLLALIVVCVGGISNYANAEETPTIDLGEGVVPRVQKKKESMVSVNTGSESKINKNIDKLLPLKEVEVTITKEDIENSNSKNVVELLQTKGSIYVKSGILSNGSIDIRGYGETASSNMKIIVDGLDYNNIDLSSFDLNSISIGNIEKVEIINGGSSTLFGNGSTSGTIKITTKNNVDSNRVSLTSNISSYGSYLNKINTEFKFNDTSYITMSLDKLDSNGYRINGSKDQTNFNTNFIYNFNDNNNIKLKYGYIDTKYGLSGSLTKDDINKYGRKYGDPDDNMKKISNDVSALYNYNNDKINILSILNYNHQNVKSIYNNVFFYTRHDKIDNYKTSNTLNYAYNKGSNILFGLDAQYNKMDVTTNFSNYINKRESYDVYVVNDNEYQLENSKLKLQKGMRYNRVQYKDVDNTKYSNMAYLLSANYNYNNIDLYASYNRNFRTPNVDEISYYGTTADYIKPQKSNDVEIGAGYKTNNTKSNISVFYSRTKNEIYYNPNANFGFGANENINGTSERIGTEISLSQNINKLTFNESSTFMQTKILDGQYKGSKIPGTSNVIFKLASNYKIDTKSSVNADLAYYSKQYAISDFYNKNEKQNDYTVVNIGYKRKFYDSLTIGLGVNNLLNDKYYESVVYSNFKNMNVYYPAAERMYYLNINYELGGK